MYLKVYRVGGGTIYIIKCVCIFKSTFMIFSPTKITMISSLLLYKYKLLKKSLPSFSSYQRLSADDNGVARTQKKGFADQRETTVSSNDPL